MSFNNLLHEIMRNSSDKFEEMMNVATDSYTGSENKRYGNITATDEEIKKVIEDCPDDVDYIEFGDGVVFSVHDGDVHWVVFLSNEEMSRTKAIQIAAIIWHVTDFSTITREELDSIESFEDIDRKFKEEDSGMSGDISDESVLKEQVPQPAISPTVPQRKKTIAPPAEPATEPKPRVKPSTPIRPKPGVSPKPKAGADNDDVELFLKKRK